MAPSEDNEANEPASTFAVQRVVLFLAVLAALIVVLWALMNGDNRDLWTQPIGVQARAFAPLVP